MSKEKEQRVAELDPNRTKIAKSMVTHGGAPNAPAPLMNNPQNAMSDPQPSSFSGVNESPYGDIGREAPEQLGGVYANPPSGLQQSATFGQGMNAWAPYGQQPQPPSSVADDFGAAQANVGNAGPPSWMGMIGQPATAAPGALPGEMSGQSPNSLGLTGMPSAEAAVGMKPKGMNTKSGKR